MTVTARVTSTVGVLLVVPTILLGLLGLAAPPAKAVEWREYCFAEEPRHCYAVEEEVPSEGLQAAFEGIDTTYMYVPGCSEVGEYGEPRFVSNEMWVRNSDYTGASRAWIETGLITAPLAYGYPVDCTELHRFFTFYAHGEWLDRATEAELSWNTVYPFEISNWEDAYHSEGETLWRVDYYNNGEAAWRISGDWWMPFEFSNWVQEGMEAGTEIEPTNTAYYAPLQERASASSFEHWTNPPSQVVWGGLTCVEQNGEYYGEIYAGTC